MRIDMRLGGSSSLVVWRVQVSRTKALDIDDQSLTSLDLGSIEICDSPI